MGPLDLKANDLTLSRSGTCMSKVGDDVFNARGRANEIGQSWCLANVL